MEIVASERIEIHCLKSVDERIDVGVSDLRTGAPEKVVELCELCAEVPDVAELLESVSSLKSIHKRYRFKHYQFVLFDYGCKYMVLYRTGGSFENSFTLRLPVICRTW